MLVEIPQPWSPAQATERIRAMIVKPSCVLHYTAHAKDQLAERELLMGDVLYLLKGGFVYDPPEPSTRPGFFKYVMSSRTPNSGSRDVASVVIPDWRSVQLKIATVMWIDEVRRSG